MGGTINKLLEPEISPHAEEYPTFAPNDGFSYERKKIEPIYTVAELDLAQVPTKFRNACVKEYLELAKCRREMRVWQPYHCEHQNHDHSHCQIMSVVDRKMEYERERRLRKRELRIAQKAAEAEA